MLITDHPNLPCFYMKVQVRQLHGMYFVNVLLKSGRRQSEEHIAKSEILVHSARIANKVYVGDSSGEESGTMETMLMFDVFVY